MQDSVLPTVAYIGGPAEIAYLAQSEAIYRVVLGRMPVVVPRAGFTILDAASQSRLERYGLSLGSFFHGEERLREQIAARLLPEKLTAALGAAAETVDTALARLRTELVAFDPTLAKALDTSNRKIHHQVDKDPAARRPRNSAPRPAGHPRGAFSLQSSSIPSGTCRSVSTPSFPSLPNTVLA